MATWRLDGSDYRNRVLADLVTGVLFYSSLSGSSGARGWCYKGLVRSDLTGVNAVLQMLVCCVHPCLCSDMRSGRSGLYDVISRLFVPSTVSAPSIEVIRAAQSFIVDHGGRLMGDGEVIVDRGDGLRRNFAYVAGLGGPSVCQVFESVLFTTCCREQKRTWGHVWLEKVEGFPLRVQCKIDCVCGHVVPFVVEEPAGCFLARAVDPLGTFTVPLNLTLQTMVDGTRPLLYDLLAVCVQDPSGRCVCYSNRPRCLSGGGTWYKFDDEVVGEVTAEELISVTGVVLMLYRVQPQSDDFVSSTCMRLVDHHCKSARVSYQNALTMDSDTEF